MKSYQQIKFFREKIAAFSFQLKLLFLINKSENYILEANNKYSKSNFQTTNNNIEYRQIL